MKMARILVIFTIVFMVFGIGFLAFSIYSSRTGTEYQFQVDAVLAAATIANDEDPLTTDPDRAVIAEYEGRRAVVVPNNYMALSSYLRKSSACMLFFSVNREKAIKLTVCNEAVFYIVPQEGSEDVVYVEFSTMGQTFHMRTHGGNQWKNLLDCCMKGTYHDGNIPLE